MNVNVVVEGESDKGAATKVVEFAGHQVTHIYGKNGKKNLDRDIEKYWSAANHGVPFVVFRDTDGHCPVDLAHRLTARIAYQSSHFTLRLAHSMTEAWLLADRAGFARYFSVAESRIPRDPESLPHAKAGLLTLCRLSRRRAIREDMVAHETRPGPLYVDRLNDFARTVWDVTAATAVSESLAHAVRRIREIS